MGIRFSTVVLLPRPESPSSRDQMQSQSVFNWILQSNGIYFAYCLLWSLCQGRCWYNCKQKSMLSYLQLLLFSLLGSSHPATVSDELLNVTLVSLHIELAYVKNILLNQRWLETSLERCKVKFKLSIRRSEKFFYSIMGLTLSWTLGTEWTRMKKYKKPYLALSF